MVAAPVSPTQPPVEEALAWEAEQRPRAGYAAITAGVLLFGTFLYTIVAFDDSPNVVLTDGFRDALGQPLTGGRMGLLTESAAWFDDNAVELLGVTALAAVGTALIAFVLGYLFRATQARRPETARFILYLALVGPVLYGTGPLISATSAVINASGYVSDGRFSTLGAHEALRTGRGIAVAQGFVGLGQLATAAAIVLISLNAMRVGLLTRFTGVLGCIVGALVILPAIFGPPAIVQSFWLVALGLLILGRVRAVPPAWATGRAEPWPSQQELRERKERAARGDAEPEPIATDLAASSAAVATDDDAQDLPHGASKKRKRKRR
jgi:hypothetical protein